MSPLPRPTTKALTTGFMPRWGSLWVGAHWSPYNRRLCVNILPCLTVWFVFRGGITP